jgi:hypothetical protein
VQIYIMRHIGFLTYPNVRTCTTALSYESRRLFVLVD